MNQPKYILDQGTRIRTHAKLGTTQGMNVAAIHIDQREADAEGTIAGVVGGCGGDVYWVTHEGSGPSAVYCYDEFELVEAAPASVYPERKAALRLNAIRIRVAAELVDDEDSGGDGDWPWPEYVNKAERRALINDCSTWNGDPENAASRNELSRGFVRGYLLAALLKHARETVTR